MNRRDGVTSRHNAITPTAPVPWLSAHAPAVVVPPYFERLWTETPAVKRPPRGDQLDLFE
jgi:hypothetical protein